ncbi:hypothetical protein NMY22_g13286 [Coprinellus aureogranulatus]|nr:hypothetical protein NMY22_g13286 [Coprinellus aureogranulatus]
MPRPRLYKTKAERQEAHRVSSLKSHHKRKVEVNRQRRKAYAAAKKKELKKLAKAEQRALRSQTREVMEVRSSDKQARECAQEQLSQRAAQFKSRIDALMGGSAHDFLSNICKNYEKIRHNLNSRATQYSIERYINIFNGLLDEMLFFFESEDEMDKDVVKIYDDVGNVVRWLEEIQEASIVKPAMVMVRFLSDGFLFQLESLVNMTVTRTRGSSKGVRVFSRHTAPVPSGPSLSDPSGTALPPVLNPTQLAAWDEGVKTAAAEANVHPADSEGHGDDNDIAMDSDDGGNIDSDSDGMVGGTQADHILSGNIQVEWSHAGGEMNTLLQDSEEVDQSRRRYESTSTRRDRLERQTQGFEAQMADLVDAYMAWEMDLGDKSFDFAVPPSMAPGGADGMWEVQVLDIFRTYRHTVGFLTSDKYPGCAFIRHGLIPSAPFTPAYAVSIRTLETYRKIHLRCPHLALEPFVKSLCDAYGVLYRHSLQQIFSTCYDVYLRLRTEAEQRVLVELKRTGLWRRKNACPACTYHLEGEAKLIFSILVTMDGNNSLKRILLRGLFGAFGVDEDGNPQPEHSKARTDSRTVAGDLYLEREAVDKWDKGAGSEEADKSLDGQEDQEENPCAQRWTNMNEEATSRMWAVFDETGIFLSLCRHGFALVLCDMVRSGELSKYPLAVVEALINVFGKDIGAGYDIGCQFQTTLGQSRLGMRAREAGYKSLVGAFHGHAHNRICQLSHLATYVPGMGIEDLEGCERIFSKSNALANSVRYASRFHRQQSIVEFFKHINVNDASENLSKFIVNNYRQALLILQGESEVKTTMELRGITSDDVMRWLEEERAYLLALKKEPIEETIHMDYYQQLVKLDLARLKLNTITGTFIPFQLTGTSAAKPRTKNSIEKDLRHAQESFDTALRAVQNIETKLNLAVRWTPECDEYKKARDLFNRRHYQRCLDELEGLVVSRIFELTKMNMAQTGDSLCYKMRKHIASALQARSQAIRTSLKRYNSAAAALRPPAMKLTWDQVVEYAFLADFDLLRCTREDIRQRPWAQPANRILMDSFFKLERAREEIQRLNIEIKRVITHMQDEEAFLLAAEQQAHSKSPTLAFQISNYRLERTRFYSLHRRRFATLKQLEGFTGDTDPGVSVDDTLRKPSNTAAIPTATSIPVPAARTMTVVSWEKDEPTTVTDADDPGHPVLQETHTEESQAQDEEYLRAQLAIFTLADDSSSAPSIDKSRLVVDDVSTHMSSRGGGRQSMSELKLRRLLEHNQRLREDLARPRVKLDRLLQKHQRSSRTVSVGSSRAGRGPIRPASNREVLYNSVIVVRWPSAHRPTPFSFVSFSTELLCFHLPPAIPAPSIDPRHPRPPAFHIRSPFLPQPRIRHTRLPPFDGSSSLQRGVVKEPPQKATHYHCATTAPCFFIFFAFERATKGEEVQEDENILRRSLSFARDVRNSEQSDAVLQWFIPLRLQLPPRFPYDPSSCRSLRVRLFYHSRHHLQDPKCRRQLRKRALRFEKAIEFHSCRCFSPNATTSRLSPTPICCTIAGDPSRRSTSNYTFHRDASTRSRVILSFALSSLSQDGVSASPVAFRRPAVSRQIVTDDNNVLFIPIAIAFLSICTLAIQASTHYALKARRDNGGDAYDEAAHPPGNIVTRNGGPVVFCFMVARILGCAALAAFSLVSLAQSVSGGHPSDIYSTDFLTLASMAAVNVYALFLSSVAIIFQSWRKSLVRHNIAILFSELAVYAYRNLWPLATYTKQPADLAEGWLLWAKLGALAFTAILVPVFIPSVYTPIDPKRPEKTPHPEQTASLISFNTYSYLTPTIDAAQKVAHLPASELPPLADYDRAQDLMKHAEPYLSPARVRRGRHIFFGLVGCFRREYLKALASMTVYPASMFLSPLAINRLLTILESGGKTSTGIKPWFWILLIFLAPFFGSMAFQYYVISMTRALATSESIFDAAHI